MKIGGSNTEVSQGVVHVPYLIETRSVDVNGVTVWHSNRLVNFCIRVKHFFWKPKALRNFEKYTNKPVNKKYYEKIKVEKGEHIR